jgi:uncharacterized protein (UPF0333 family)
MDNKGQMTMEGILIMGFFILIFVGISFPAMIKVYKASNDASIILESRENLDKISKAIEMVRANGNGSIRTVTIKSSSLNWSISAYDSDNPNNDILTYWIKWKTTDRVPSELIKNGSSGGLGKNSIEGVSSSGNESSSGYLSPGTYSVKIENRATTTSPEISISANGTTVLITLED